jgi:general secretion pathway protein G
MKKFREILSSGDRGFTLIELLVVIAVLGILAGIAVPRLTGVTDRAKKSEAVAALGSLKTALEIEELETGSYPTSIGSIAKQYLDGITSNSATAATWEGWTISYSTPPTSSSSVFTIDMTKDSLTAQLKHDSNGYEIID